MEPHAATGPLQTRATPTAEARLSDRQLAVLREAARVSCLVSIVEFPGGRVEDVAGSGWQTRRVPLPNTGEVRSLIRSGHLAAAALTASTSFHLSDRGRQAAVASVARH